MLRAVADFASSNILSVIQNRDGFRFVLGDPDVRVNHLSWPEEPGAREDYSDALVEWASQQGLWRGDLDPGESIAVFKDDPARFFKTLDFVPQPEPTPPPAEGAAESAKPAPKPKDGG